VHAKRHSDQRAWATCKLILFGEKLNSFNLVSGQQSPAKSPRLSPGHSLGQKQPEVSTSSACFQTRGNVLVGQRSGQVAQALPTLLVVSIQAKSSLRSLSAQAGKRLLSRSVMSPYIIPHNNRGWRFWGFAFGGVLFPRSLISRSMFSPLPW
jgi:hypothetical protein